VKGFESTLIERGAYRNVEPQTPKFVFAAEPQPHPPGPFIIHACHLMTAHMSDDETN
jgi:hypothetical protein